MKLRMFLAATAVASTIGLGLAACGGGGGSSPTTPSTGGGASTTATITITTNGVEPKTIDITVGQQVFFMNSDARSHEMLSTPHEFHTDCPPINDVGMLSPGARRATGALDRQRICGFHDHLNPDDQRFRGQINVGTAEGPLPGYVVRE